MQKPPGNRARHEAESILDAKLLPRITEVTVVLRVASVERDGLRIANGNCLVETSSSGSFNVPRNCFFSTGSLRWSRRGHRHLPVPPQLHRHQAWRRAHSSCAEACVKLVDALVVTETARNEPLMRPFYADMTGE